MLPQFKLAICWIFGNKLTMEIYGYKLKSLQSLTSQPLLRIKYLENGSCMLVLQDRHNFVFILVNWLTEKMIIMFLHFKILLQWDYEMLHIWDHLQNCYILKIKLLHLCEYEKKCCVLKLILLHLWEYLENCHFFTGSAAFPGKSTNLLFQYKLRKIM